VQLDISDSSSISACADHLRQRFGRLDCLVNNAAIAFKAADPTPFNQQTKPTLDVNLRGTLDLTEALLPLMIDASAEDARIVNVASMSGKLRQVSSALQDEFTSSELSLAGVRQLADRFEEDVRSGVHKARGWGSSNYGLSKLCLIAATRVLARANPSIKVNCCCPGYCDTDSTLALSSRLPSPAAYALLASRRPLGRWGADIRARSRLSPQCRRTRALARRSRAPGTLSA
jgi:carbonyl reductase 1